MNNEPKVQPEKPPAVALDENLICDVCGRFGALELGERCLCPDCYEGCGSCCPEFGKENADHWQEAD